MKSVHNRSALKLKAIELRKRSFTYSEILKQVPVAKSTLSLWLKEVSLSKPQKQTITQKRIDAALRGAASRHRQRLENTEKITTAARKQIGKLSRREFWLLGTALYWAEGSKQRISSLSASVTFNNSDPVMLSFFKEWLFQICNIELSRLRFELYVHESQKHRLKEIQHYWIKNLSIPAASFTAVYFKKNTIKRVRKNPEIGYYGLVRIRVRASSQLNRTIAGWVQGIVENWGIV